MESVVSIIVVLAVFVLVFFLPGYTFVAQTGIRSYRVVWAIALSYLYAIAVISVTKAVGFSPSVLIGIFCSVPLVGVVIWFVKSGLKSGNKWFGRLDKRSSGSVFGDLALGVFLVACLIWVGPFNEIPTDFWAHLEAINLERKSLENGLFKGVNVWYLLTGIIWFVTGVEAASFVWALYLFSSSIFALSTFLLIREYLVKAEVEKSAALVFSLVGTASFLVSFGLGPFSYFRYYSFAPGFIPYILYLGVIFILLRLNHERHGSTLGFLAIAILTAYLVHRQEALFMGLTVVTFFLVRLSLTIFKTKRIESVNRLCDETLWQSVWRTHHLKLAIGLVILFSVGLGVYSADSAQLEKCISAGFCSSFGMDGKDSGTYFVIGNPEYNFASAIGLVGLVAIAMSFLNFKINNSGSVFLLVTLVITFFNPLYVSLFLTMSSGEVLWRHAYLFPGALILTIEYARLLQIKKVERIIQRRRSKMWRFLFFTSPFLAIMVASTGFALSIDGKRMTFRAVPSETSHEQWGDLVHFLSKFPATTHLLTDPVTGYVLSGLTKVSHSRWKFHKVDYIEFNLPGYSPGNYDAYVGWLLVVNQRDGGKSHLGEASGHWSREIMQVSRHYSPEFLRHVASAPHRFEEIWRKDMIVVYQIVDK